VHHVDARSRLEHFHNQMMLAAVADRSIGERRVRAAGKCYEVLEGFYRQSGVDSEQHLGIDQARDRQQVLQRIERHFRVKMRADDDLRVRAEQQCVAIGRRFGYGLHGDVAVGPGTVLDDHRLAERLAKLRREQPRDGIGCSAGRIGHEEPDRPCGVLGRRDSSDEKQNECD
jgi:hypothetical protein